jgi:shikimate kinase
MKIVLIGFMGAGKTSIATLLAGRLSFGIIDMDQCIIKESGRISDTEIFDKDGEEVFRTLETKIAEGLKDADNVVISTGGGIISNKTNIDSLKNNAVIIFLKNTFETSKKRLYKNNLPPLFRNKKNAKKLYIERLPLYLKYADIVIETDKKSKEEIVKEIIKKV